MLPNFLVIGTAKCGTTSVCTLIDQHPDAFVTEPKEPHYFSRLATWRSKRDWYESLFRESTNATAAGEGSVAYTLPSRIDFTAPRIKKTIPACRLILMVRDPVKRLESDWRMRAIEGRNMESINTDVETHVDLVLLGMYWKTLNVYRELFDDEQLLVVFLEDLAGTPRREMRRIYEHIGVDPDFVPHGLDERHNTIEDRRQALAVAELAEHIPGIRRLGGFLPNPLIEWGKGLLSGRDKFHPEIDWDDDVRQGVEEFLRPDSRRFLEFCGKDPDFWGFV